MNLLLLCDWANVIDSIPCLVLWLIITVGILTGFYLYLKYCKNPDIANGHELRMKEEAFKREKEWAKIEEAKVSTQDSLIHKNRKLKLEILLLQEELNFEKKKGEILEKELRCYKDKSE